MMDHFENQMHILIIGKSVFEGMAGTRRLQNNLLPLLSHKNVTISNLIYSGKIIKNNPLTRKIRAARITYSIYNPLSFIVFLYSGKKFIKSMCHLRKKNILYVYGYPNILNILFIKYARKLGYRIVFDIVEDNNLLTDLVNPLSLFNNKISLYYLKKIETLCDGCIVISSHLFKVISQYASNVPLIKIPISVNPEVFPLKSVICENNNTTKIFYGGSFAPKDGLDVLLEAIKIVSKHEERVVLIVTGKASKRLMDRFFYSVNKMGISKLIEYKGFLSFDDYYKAMLSANIFCMTRIDTPYSNAGFPFKLGEMLSTGKPVIATKVGDVENYLDKRSAILINPGDPSALASAILFLIKNQQLALTIGAEGKKKAEIYFNASKISQNLFRFLSNHI